MVLYKYSNNYIHIIISKDCHIKVNLNHLSHSKVRSRGVINGKTDKVRQLSYPNIQICSSLHIIISQDCHIQVNHDHLNHSKVGSRVINGKTGKTAVLRPPRPGPCLKSGLQLTLSQPGGGADYAHHNTMGLVWLKFNVAPLCMVSI